MILTYRDQQYLTRLKRIITKFNGKFSLIFVNCNDRALASPVFAQLEQDLTPDDYSVLMLAPTTQSLHKTILTHIEKYPPKALIVLGLEVVVDIDNLLTRANQTRDQFSSDFPFPLILWTNDSVSKKLVRIAPDFHSWGTSVSLTTENE